ncbi:S16 family serine protease [Ideonella sp. YS5]|uniref:S16 family serine protease n=1 Tax=Ideonella sp. YS5 TaxID=3453714 RepID=UPI003EF063C4
MPDGTIPKDGPSAGVAIVVSLASLFTDRSNRGRRPARRPHAGHPFLTLESRRLWTRLWTSPGSLLIHPVFPPRRTSGGSPRWHRCSAPAATASPTDRPSPTSVTR